ncbi:chemotaxis protein CheW [Bradymonadaceae bacterium TMQ3]|uniref:Chemotaxis protein CheW n=1 Tax=Lujinxingia sediminis TaxID=2480984 RepID=A0ABY0CR78_9DELT|nr:chemotaxis protein CheW [Lujinxingia sediminis]RDV37673.1 chemotaxis protein CheW [Bradymonadaceae bacterium TMQ3]RVU43076.1 chemotaxis protein CheW [Lujinxingia sediminis]TXC75543.1 chemotaxis protein CheW [Bradymonadales bacterium TMQ1]
MASDDTKSPSDFSDLVDQAESLDPFAWDDLQDQVIDEVATIPVVCFRCGEDDFAIDGQSVREIVGQLETTPLPGAPGHIRGIAVLRRQVIGVLDLSTFLESQSAGPALASHTRRTLIVDTPHYTVGLDVDEVTGLDEWPEHLLREDALPTTIKGSTRRYAIGAHPLGEELCVLLDIERLLDDAAVR